MVNQQCTMVQQQQQQPMWGGSRRRRLDPWKVAAVAATSMAFSVAAAVVAPTAPAFVAPFYRTTLTTRHQPRDGGGGGGIQTTAFHVTETTVAAGKAPPSSSFRRDRPNVVNDADTLRSMRNQRDAMGRLFHASPSDANTVVPPLPLPLPITEQSRKEADAGTVADTHRTSTAARAESIQQPVRKKQRVKVTMTKNPTRHRSGSGGGSRSSTMPGMGSSSTTTDRQRAFQDGIRLVEERTGRRFTDTAEQQKKRRKVNGEAMYKNSPSVPDSMVQFAEEIHQVERITRKEEIELGEKTQEAIRLQNLYHTLETKLAREPTDEEWCAASGKINMEAIGQAMEEGNEAKNKLVTANLRMVQSVVNAYIRNGLSAQYNAGDLMQEGIIALIRAAEKFEPERGWKFSTYAMYWVRASVKRSQIYQSRIISVPQRLTENHKRLQRIEKEIALATGKKPTRKELGMAVGMSELQVDRCMAAMAQRCHSLDQEIHNTLKPSKYNERKDTLLEIMESKAVDSEHDYLQRVMLREDLIETLNRYLSPEEVEVLLLRYGLKEGPTAAASSIRAPSGTDRQVTIAELSRIFDIKPDKVRRMIDNSLKQLKGAGMEEWLAFERDIP